MNKSTKIWVNYLAGAIISGFLLWNIYVQVASKQQEDFTHLYRLAAGKHQLFLWVAVGLMFVNIFLEGCKWNLLANFVDPVPFHRSFASYLAGVAISIVTPNRVGEYPARILYLGRQHTAGYISVSVLGVISQLTSIYALGFFGLVYYNVRFPSLPAQIALIVCMVLCVLGIVAFWRFQDWWPRLGNWPLLRRFAVYGKLLLRVPVSTRVVILLLSITRGVIFTAQYLFLLWWLGVAIPLVGGFCTAALFFWVMAVVPTISLTELGVRGNVSLELFGVFSPDALPILAASAALWFLNLIIPAVVGSLLLLRMRLLK